MSDATPSARPANLLRAEAWQFEYRQKSNPANSNLDMLTYGVYRVAPGASSDELFHRAEETLLFCLAGAPVSVEVEGRTCCLSHYDTLYVPLATPYYLHNRTNEIQSLVVCRAPAAQRHAVVHTSWEHVRGNEARTRHLEGKDVFLMFDVTEAADRLMAGYTIYRPFTRAWPPHNHTDQEEIYLFTKGRGSIEVYADDKSKTFVHSMGTLDAATIPLLNYHPVFSQEEELHFIWCLAGARYWVGDKHKEFLNASVDRLTT
ncbi:MAG: cupin domain-containing protein [Planctomycetes bacterium]|nr:cupin domain-containing protein [Planctomycetota bacterium]